MIIQLVNFVETRHIFYRNMVAVPMLNFENKKNLLDWGRKNNIKGDFFGFRQSFLKIKDSHLMVRMDTISYRTSYAENWTVFSCFITEVARWCIGVPSPFMNCRSWSWWREILIQMVIATFYKVTCGNLQLKLSAKRLPVGFNRTTLHFILNTTVEIGFSRI